MNVTLNELINNRNSDNFVIDGNTFTAGYCGNYVAVEFSSVFSSDDVEDDNLMEMEADNFNEFKEEVMNLLAGTGFNDWNMNVQDNDNASGGMDLGFIPDKGYLMDGCCVQTPGFSFPSQDNNKDLFVCEVLTPENTGCTLTITLDNYNLKCDKDYKVINVESHDDYEDNPGSYCDFGAWVSDKCYYKLWKRYLTITGKDV